MIEELRKHVESLESQIERRDAEIEKLEGQLQQKAVTTTVTTTKADLKTWILVLSTYSSSNKPLIIDGHGQSKQIGFAYDSKTEADGSCSVIWRGNMFIFGGWSHKKQISMVDQCQLKRVGDLPFDMVFGACARVSPDL